MRRLVTIWMRFLTATTVVLCSLALSAAGWGRAVPKPAPKYWSPARCERAMLARPLAPPSQVLCVGSGGPSACRSTAGHRSRLYSEFTVFERFRHTGVRGVGIRQGVVRSFTLATRTRPGFIRVISHWGDQYAGWPADFFRTKYSVLTTGATPAGFRALAASSAAPLIQEEKATDCVSG